MEKKIINMKSFLIVESQYRGHYLTGYIKYVLRALPKNEFNIVLLITKDAKKFAGDELKILKKENNRIIIETMDDIKISNYNSISLLLYQLKLYFLIKDKFNQIKKKYNFFHIFINSFQHFDKIFSIIGSPFDQIKFSGVFLGTKFHLNTFNFNFYDRYNFLSKLLFKRLISNHNLLSLIINDELLLHFLKKKKWRNLKKVKFLHDPKEFNFKFSKLYSRNRLKLPNKSFLILLYGAIINSKSVDELLSIFTNKNIDGNIKVIVAGEHVGEMKLYFKNPKVLRLIQNKKLFIYNGWQSEVIESLIFSAVDIVWIGYKNYPFPSGVLYQAVSKSLPVITSSQGAMSWTNKKYKLGLVANINKTADIIEKINKLKNKFFYRKLQKNIKKFSSLSSSTHWVNYFKFLHSSIF